MTTINESKLAQAFREAFGVDPLNSDGVFAIRNVSDFASSIGVQVCEDVTRANPGKMATADERKRNAKFLQDHLPSAVDLIENQQAVQYIVKTGELGIGYQVRVDIREWADPHMPLKLCATRSDGTGYVEAEVRAYFWDENSRPKELVHLATLVEGCIFSATLSSIKEVKIGNKWLGFDASLFDRSKFSKCTPSSESLLDRWKRIHQAKCRKFPASEVKLTEEILRQSIRGPVIKLTATHIPSGVETSIIAEYVRSLHAARAKVERELRDKMADRGMRAEFRRLLQNVVQQIVFRYCVLKPIAPVTQFGSHSVVTAADQVEKEIFGASEFSPGRVKSAFYSAFESVIEDRYKYMENWLGINMLAFSACDILLGEMQKQIDEFEGRNV